MGGEGQGGQVDRTPAPVSKVIFGRPLRLRLPANRRMNQPTEEEQTSSSRSGSEESQVSGLRMAGLGERGRPEVRSTEG